VRDDVPSPAPGDAFRARYQHLYVLLLRPAGLAVTLLTFLLYELLEPGRELEELTVIVACCLLVTPVLLAVRSRASLAAATRAGLLCDTALIAGAMSLFARPEPGAIGFVWTIFISSFLLTPRDTFAFTSLAVVASAVVPPLSVPDPQWVNAISDMLALSLAGLLSALLSRQSKVYERRLSAAQRRDRVALELARRISAPSEFWERLGEFAAALGAAVSAAEVSIAPASGEGVRARWRSVGEEPASTQELTRRVSGRPPPGLDVVVRGSVASLEEADALLTRLAPQFVATLAEAELLAEHQAARRRLEELARLRQELVARVSHELRTPLTSIVGFLATLRRPDLRLDEEERQRYLEIAGREAERLGRLVDDVLSVSRDAARRLNVGVCDLAGCCREAATLVGVAGARPVELELEQRVEVVADRDRVMEILVNLLANSQRHGQGPTRVRCAVTNGGGEISVSDDGRGVEAELLPALFEPFASGRTTGDTGLGLAVARGLADAHGGSLTYRPPRDGEPHAFVLWLPREPGRV
jgi:signal transduction histidine kinase